LNRKDRKIRIIRFHCLWHADDADTSIADLEGFKKRERRIDRKEKNPRHPRSNSSGAQMTQIKGGLFKSYFFESFVTDFDSFEWIQPKSIVLFH
jgi:hypothetical protein